MHIILLHFYGENPTPEWMNIAKQLRLRGHTVWSTHSKHQQIIFSDERGEVARFAEPQPAIANQAGMPLTKSLAFRYQQFRYLQTLRRFLRQTKPDIVHVNPAMMHWLWFIPFLMPEAMHFVLDWRQLGERPTATPLGKLKNEWLKVRRYIYSKYCYDKASFLHEAGAQRALGAEWRQAGAVVPMGVDNQFFQVESKTGKDKSIQEKVRFLYIGSLDPIRQLDRILTAVQQIQKETTAFEVDFLGPDTSQGWYQKLIQELGIGNYVRILPPIPYTAIPETVLQYDVAFAYVPAQPADWQYHPTLKVLEYRALGIPIIATDLAPNREVVVHGQNGLLVQNDPAAVATAMLRFITDRAFLASCTEHATSMRQGDTWADVAFMYEELYLSLSRRVAYPQEAHHAS